MSWLPGWRSSRAHCPMRDRLGPSLCQEANNGKRFLFFYRRISFFRPTLRIIQDNNSAQHSGMPKDTTSLRFQRKHLRNTILLWQNNTSHEMGFPLPQAQNNAALWQASWSARLPIAAVQLLNWHLFKDSLKHSFSTFVSSCLNQFLYKKKPKPNPKINSPPHENASCLCQKVTVWKWSPRLWKPRSLILLWITGPEKFVLKNESSLFKNKSPCITKYDSHCSRASHNFVALDLGFLTEIQKEAMRTGKPGNRKNGLRRKTGLK